VVDQCVEAAKSIGPGPAGFVNGVLRTAAEHKEEYREAPFLVAGAEGLSLRYGMPRWLVDRYLVRYGEEEAERLLAALQEPAGAVLFFPDAGRLAQARPLLEREGFLQKPDPAFPLTLHVSGGNPADSEAFRRGLFYVADPASQVPALLLPVAPGGRVLDLCAAPGGKTVVLAGRVSSGGWVLSTDVNRRRILRIEENVARLGLKNVRLAQVDAARALPFGPGWPSVLLDAPCSALGTLRRNPEIRWQIKPEAFPIFADRQHAFLRQAASAVAPGGHLLYSVCTLEREETTEVVERFLAEERSFRPAALEPLPFLAPLLERAGEGAAYCLPHRHGWDGFFVALFRKKS
jgi:16S rRNA (cytosine967-C5)-methyltransferase